MNNFIKRNDIGGPWPIILPLLAICMLFLCILENSRNTAKRFKYLFFFLLFSCSKQGTDLFVFSFRLSLLPPKMVLVLNGVLQDDCPMDTASLFMQHPIYRDYAQQLLNIPTKSVGPVGLLYVGQREMAAAAPHDKNINIIGTDDATTCIIVVVRHSGRQAYVYSFMCLLISRFVFSLKFASRNNGIKTILTLFLDAL